MFDIGFWELLFIFVLGLLILGPERLPRVARTVGLWTGRARGMVRRLQREIEREVTLAELQDRQIHKPPPAATPRATDGQPGDAPDERRDD